MALLVIGALLSACGSSEPSFTPPPDNATALPASNVIAPAPAPSPRLTREQLREKARTDPDGADAQAIDQMSRNELVATAINSAGYLCARVTDLYPSGDDIVAKCVEYRSGSGTVRYRVNPSASTVEPM